MSALHDNRCYSGQLRVTLNYLRFNIINLFAMIADTDPSRFIHKELAMKRIVKSSLTAALISSIITFTTPASAAATAATNGNSVSPAERAKIEEVVRQYLIAKPEVIVEAMQVLQGRQVEQAKQSIGKTQKDAPRFAKALFNTPNDPVAGNVNGKVTVTEFFDYQCPHCVEMGPVLEGAIKANPEVRVVFKEWPIRGPMSELAAKAALAANKQGKYMAFHDALLGINQPLNEALIMEVATKAGLNVDQLKKDINDPKIEAQLKDNMKLAQDLKLFGTPAFFIGLTTGKNDKITYVPGQLNLEQLQKMIADVGK